MAFLFLFFHTALAAELAVNPSATEIGEDENLSIEFKIAVEGTGGGIGEVKFDAPDFDEINRYSSSGFESTYVNGQFTAHSTQSVVAVLHPRKAGRLAITGIQANAGGQVIRAPDVFIEVRSGGSSGGLSRGRGALTYPPPRQLPGGGIQPPSGHASAFFLKTEPDRLKAYKGEQIILTYALYTRVQLMNIQVERYPNINGFLKEDIDIPLLRQRLEYSPSVVNGHEYRRAPLAQYAIYPLKEGQLPLDVFTGKFSYQAGSRSGFDQDDPFAMLNQFFRAMQMATDTRSSDRVTIDVQPLPAAGQPAGFSGLVGDFEITAVVDKYTTKVGDPINVKVKVEGKGHAGSLERLNVAWPADFELYEDKSNTQFIKTGHTERLFEYMLIPKTKGKFEIPPIELSMFNPETGGYQVRKSQALPVEVLEGSLGNVYVPKGKAGAQQASGDDIRYWMERSPEARGYKVRSVARGAALAAMALAFLSLWSLGAAPDEASRQARARADQAIRARAQALTKSTASPAEIFGQVESVLAQALELQYGIRIGSLTRTAVGVALAGRAEEGDARRIEALLELCENQRFMPGGGDALSARSAAEELERLTGKILSGKFA